MLPQFGEWFIERSIEAAVYDTPCGSIPPQALFQFSNPGSKERLGYHDQGRLAIILHWQTQRECYAAYGLAEAHVVGKDDEFPLAQHPMQCLSLMNEELSFYGHWLCCLRPISIGL